jgi:dTDP-4-amino-4,6-dideoxygalactose transaminase
MVAFVADIRSGDEVISQSYSFVSKANAFVLRDGMPDVVDILADGLNIDQSLAEAAITPRKKATNVFGDVEFLLKLVMVSLVEA